MEFWLFNTDESEPQGRGKYADMLRKQVVAAWGSCKELGAEVTLNRANPGDVIFYYRAGHGIIARAVATDDFSYASQMIFGETGEYIRHVIDVQALPTNTPITVAEIKAKADYQIPFRQIMGRIRSPAATSYVEERFRTTPKKPSTHTFAPSVASRSFFQPDPAIRKKVETAAVLAVTKVYEKAGWTVKSVERENVSYDLLCTKGDTVEKVEVKGTAGIDQRFIITANELAKVEMGEVTLYVVTNALEQPTVKKYAPAQLLEAFNFEPTQYRAIVKP